MSRSHSGMQKNVQVALDLVLRKGPPELNLGRCLCGVDRTIGTDICAPSLRSRGLAFGRVIDYCPRCLHVSRIDPGPKMLTREDKEPIDFVVVTDKNGRTYRRPKARG